MTIFQTPISWQNQLIPSENNLARSCVDRIANHVESGGWVNGLQSRILAVSTPVIFSIGAVQSGVKFACHLGLAFSGQSHQLKQSTIELIKMIGAVVLSIALFVPTTIFSSAYRINEQLFEISTKTEMTATLAFNGCIKTYGGFGHFIHPKHCVTLQFKKGALNHPSALIRQLNVQDGLSYDRLVIDSSEALNFVKNHTELFNQAATVVIKNVTLDKVDWLEGQFSNVACFDFRGSRINCKLKKLEEKHIVVTNDSCNLAHHFNKLCDLNLKLDSKTDNPAAKLVEWVDFTGKNYADEDIKEISSNLKKLFPKINYLILDKNATITEQAFHYLAQCELSSIRFKGCPEIGKDPEAFKTGLNALANDQLRHLIFDGLGTECTKIIEQIKKKHTQLRVSCMHTSSNRRRARSGSAPQRRVSSVV